jgi:hypothetical protein
LYKIRKTLGNYNNISNAFLKALELYAFVDKLHGFPVKEQIRHFDNAALPGDFIRACNYYTNYQYEWRANSLIGHMDDRFLLRQQFPERWLMTDDMNGDITNDKNIDYIAESLRDFGTNLYTSDLGFETDKISQEKDHLVAHISQIILGLKTLSTRGAMITKHFSLLETTSQRVLGLLTRVFRTVKLFKPQTSKADNSEIYIVCVDYAPHDLVLQAMISLLDHVQNATDLIKSVPYNMNAEFVDMACDMTIKQIKKIHTNIQMYNNRAHVDFTKDVDAWITDHTTGCATY